MKKRNYNAIIFVLILIVIISLVYSGIYFYLPKMSNNSSTENCKYDSNEKSYIKTDPNCVINFLCTRDRKAFKDNCGCGCELIASNNTEIKKNYCTESQKNAEFCPEIYHQVCGWFNQSIRCFKYPCAEEFSNECFSCASKNVEYWTEGSCPN